MFSKRWMTVLMAMVLALSLVSLPGYAAPRHADNKSVAGHKIDARVAILDAADAYAARGPAHIISAADLYGAVQANDLSYQIVDVRSAEHYALGHIYGAVNIPFQTIADDVSLARLDSTKKIVVVCYTGETASMTTMVWSLLGYDARALLFGMSGWVADEAVVGLPFPDGQAAGYPTVTTPTKPRSTYRAPRLAAKYDSVAEAVKGQTKAYFARGLAPVMTAAQVNEIVQTGDPRYQIVSVRESADYATGHIDGAVNLVWSDIANQVNKLDPTKTTIVYCYTGNLGGEDTMLLNLMGYESYNMMSGMSAWNSDPSVGGLVGYDPSRVVGYPTLR